MTTRYGCRTCNGCKEKKKCNNTHTWTSLNGRTRRQIDFLAITSKQRNWIVNIDKKQNASNTSTRQHKMVIATIRRKYNKGDKLSHRRKQHIDFDLSALRNSTEAKPLKIRTERINNNILKNYEDENEWERINRIWKPTKKND